jgi:putative flippase GtrA
MDALPPIVRQFVAYGTIGAGTTTFDAAFFALLVTTFDWREGVMPTVASTGSYMTAAAIAYVLNSRIAFRAQHRGDSVGTMTRFALTFASSALLAAGVFALAHTILGGATSALMASKGIAIVTIIIWNFTLLRLWVFRDRGDSPPPGGAEAPADGATRDAR